MTENPAYVTAPCADCARCWDEFGDDVIGLLVTKRAAESWLDRYHAEGHDLEGVRAVIAS